jgi:RNA polymerase sigma-70 factor (ECF subfamily)
MGTEATDFDGAKFSQAILRTERQLRAVVLAMVPGCRDVDDILQESCSAMWKKIDQYNPQHPFAPWACGYVRMQTLAWLKKQKRDRLALSSESMDMMYDAIVANNIPFRSSERVDALEECLSVLPQRDRMLLALRYVDGQSVQQIVSGGQTQDSCEAMYKFFSRLKVKLLNCIEGKLAR